MMTLPARDAVGISEDTLDTPLVQALNSQQEFGGGGLLSNTKVYLRFLKLLF
jgi:hypothetical protein